MSLQLDHIVILVKDLQQAKEDFTALGFRVSEGGIHSGGLTHNALIHFQNGTFLELLAVRKNFQTSLLALFARWGGDSLLLKSKRSGFQARFIGRALACKEGITDFCLLATESLQDYEAIRNRKLELTLPIKMHRQRPDGIVLEWQIFCPFDKELPFVMTPYQPKIPHSSALLTHPNQVEGIGGISVRVENLEKAIRQYKNLLGFAPKDQNTSSCRFETLTGFIELHQKKEPSQGGGFGIFNIHFLSTDTFVLDAGKLHGMEF